MKHLFYTLLLTGILMGCSKTTTMIASWKRPDFVAKKYQKLGVVVFSPRMSSRAIVETDMAYEFRVRGVKAIGTFDVFPFAGRKELIQKMDPEELKQKVRKRVNDMKMDALLTITVLDKEKEQRYVQGTNVSVGVGAPIYGAGYPYYSGHAAYRHSYYGYYAYAAGTVYDNGYYTTTTTYFVETNVYDVETEQLIWTGQTKTKDPDSLEKESKNFAKLIVDEILKKQVLVP